MSRRSETAVSRDPSLVYSSDGTPLFEIESEFSLDVGATVRLSDARFVFRMTADIRAVIFEHVEKGEYQTLILDIQDPLQHFLSSDLGVKGQLWDLSSSNLTAINAALAGRMSPLANLTIHNHRFWNDETLALILTVVERSVRDDAKLVLRMVTHGPDQMDQSFVWKLMGVLMRADGASRRHVSLVFEARDTRNTTLQIAELVGPLRVLLTANSVVRALSIYRNTDWEPYVKRFSAESEVVDVFQMDILPEEVAEAPILFEMIGDIATIDHLWIALKGSAQLDDEGAAALARLLERSSPPMQKIALLGSLADDGAGSLFLRRDIGPRIFRAIGAMPLDALTLAHQFTREEVDNLILGRNEVPLGNGTGGIRTLTLRYSIFEEASFVTLLSAMFRTEARLFSLDLSGSRISRDVANVLALHLQTESCPLHVLMIDDCPFQDGTSQIILFSAVLLNISLVTLQMRDVVISDDDLRRRLRLELDSVLTGNRDREDALK